MTMTVRESTLLTVRREPLRARTDPQAGRTRLDRGAGLQRLTRSLTRS